MTGSPQHAAWRRRCWQPATSLHTRSSVMLCHLAQLAEPRSVHLWDCCLARTPAKLLTAWQAPSGACV